MTSGFARHYTSDWLEFFRGNTVYQAGRLPFIGHRHVSAGVCVAYNDVQTIHPPADLLIAGESTELTFQADPEPAEAGIRPDAVPA